MRRFAALSFSILALAFFLYGQKNSCIECHQGLEKELREPVKAVESDVHVQFGLGCQDCHGGNASQADIELAKDKTYKGVPKRDKIPEFCGSCHADSQYIRKYNPRLRVDQLSLYWTSQHGQSLKKGDPKVAVCTDCHSHHGIRPASHPKSMAFPWNIPQTCGRCHADPEYMKPYKVPTNQLAEYKQSVHARALFEKKDLSAPVCNDCHGNHGANPPEVAAVAFVCRQCHPANGELFSKSPHKKAFDAMGFTECEACHGNHKILEPTDVLLGVGKDAICIQCHDAGSKGYQVASQMSRTLSGFLAGFQEAQALLSRAEQQGVEVTDPKFRLQDANTLLIQIRSLSHDLSLGEFEEKISDGEKVVSEVRKAGIAALKEAKFRRTSLVIVTLILFLLAVALFAKIKGMRKRQP